MENLDLLKLPEQELQLAGIVFKYKEMTAGKALRAVELYQKANALLYGQVAKGKQQDDILSNVALMKRYQNMIIDTCLFVIKPTIKQDGFLKWFKFGFATRKWIYANSTTKQLEAFIKLVLKPILGDDAIKKVEAVEKILKP